MGHTPRLSKRCDQLDDNLVDHAVDSDHFDWEGYLATVNREGAGLWIDAD